MRILAIGESHIQSVKSALMDCSEEFSVTAPSINVFKYLKTKNGRTGGDMTHEEMLKFVSQLNSNDIVVTAIGGNQHHILSLVQHPKEFHLLNSSSVFAPQDVECVPRSQLADTLSKMVEIDLNRLVGLRRSASCGIFCIIPPPPKEDNSFLLGKAGTTFINAGIKSFGVSSPCLRLEVYRIQCEIIIDECNKNDISIIFPPEECCTSSGFLSPEYYAEDATHANVHYGRALLHKIIESVAGENSIL